jgi:hypothetical protein
MTLKEQVKENVKRVLDAYKNGLANAQGSDAKKGIMSLRKLVEDWANAGLVAADKGEKPRDYTGKLIPNGWDGWIKSGEEKVKGINEIVPIETPGLFKILLQTATATTQDIKTGAEKAGGFVLQNPKMVLAGVGLLGLGVLALALRR